MLLNTLHLLDSHIHLNPVVFFLALRAHTLGAGINTQTYTKRVSEAVKSLMSCSHIMEELEAAASTAANDAFGKLVTVPGSWNFRRQKM